MNHDEDDKPAAAPAPVALFKRGRGGAAKAALRNKRQKLSDDEDAAAGSGQQPSGSSLSASDLMRMKKDKLKSASVLSTASSSTAGSKGRSSLAAATSAAETHPTALTQDISFKASGTAASLVHNSATRTLDVDGADDDDNDADAGRILAGDDAERAGGDLYKGMGGYKEYVNRKTEKVTQSNAGGIRAGPLRGTTNVRISSRFDYQPDICKDYKETGYCLSEDSQLLTSAGFLFLDEYLSVRDRVLVGAFNAQSNSLVYEHPSGPVTVIPARQQKMVQFMQASMDSQFDGTECGQSASDPASGMDRGALDVHRNNVSLLVTPEHTMYLATGKREPMCSLTHWDSEADVNAAKTSGGSAFKAMTAAAALDYARADSLAMMKLVASASNGIQLDDASTPLLPFIAALRLANETQVLAFLKLLGYWLGSGHLEYSSPNDTSARAICFSLSTPRDIAFLHVTFEDLGLVEGRDWRFIANIGEQFRVDIFTECYVTLFFDEYGHKASTARSVNKESKRIQPLEQSTEESGMTAAAETKTTGDLHGIAGDDRIVHVESKDIKSPKWMPNWAWLLSKDRARALLAGLCMADGKEAGNANRIWTSSPRFRDEIVRLALHAGYTSHFNAEYFAGESRGLATATATATQAHAATHDSWTVDYTDDLLNPSVAQPVLHAQRDVKEVDYSGRTWCVTVPSSRIFVRRAVASADGAVLYASRPVVVGNCGYGDSCKFMHDRGDYKAGWQLDKEWDAQQLSKQAELDPNRFLINSDDEDDGGSGVKKSKDEDDVDSDDDLPFACLICRNPFKNPVVTKCNHYFDEKCAISHYVKTPKCFACGANTAGVFNVAKDLVAKLEAKKKRMAEREAEIKASMVNDNPDADDDDQEAGDDNQTTAADDE